MKRFRLFVFLALLIPMTLPAAAQRNAGQAGTISGHVIDAETGDAVASATVAVWQAADSTLVTGAVSNTEGAFRIEGVRPGSYYVKVSFVGYVSATVHDVAIGQETRQVDLGTITLEPDVASLDEVEVTGERGQVQVEIDRTVYNTADDPVAIGGTATNVLETIPSVDVDADGNISLRGSGNVAVLINGRPAPVSAEFLPSYLQQLPAGTIERVEVIPNPSARYEPDGMSGIINIVLKEDAERGLGGTVTAGVDTQGGYDATGTVTYGSGPWTLAASYGFRQDEGGGGGESFRINRYATPLTFLDQTEDEDESETSHLLNVSADYALTRRTTLTSSAQFGLDDEVENERNLFIEQDAERDPTLRYERLVEEADDRWDADLRLGLRHVFGNNADGRGRSGDEHTLTAEARYNTSVNDGLETYREQIVDDGELRELQQADTDRERDEASLQVDYVRPLGNVRLEAGYKGDLERHHSDLFSQTRDNETGAFAPDTHLNNTFDYEEQIHAVYGQARWEWGALGLQAGLRAESARTTFLLKNTGENFENDYASLFPSAFLTYELNEENTVKASYSRRINRPRTWFLNPFPSFDDPLNVRMGNPSLEPEYVNAFEVGYVRYTPWGSLTFSPYYRRTTNVIRRFQRLRDDGVTVRTVENFDTSDSYGVELIGSFEGQGALSGLRGYASLEGYRLVTDGSSVDADLQNDAFGWGGRLNASYRLGNRLGLGGLDLQGNVFYRAPMDTEQGRMGARTFVNIALRQELLDSRGSLTLRFRDPFGMAGFAYELDQPTLYQEFERDWGAQQIGLTFSYTFGQPERQRDRDRADRGRGGGDFDDVELE